MEQLTSNPYMVPECAYAVNANTLFERCPLFSKNYKYSILSYLLYEKEGFSNNGQKWQHNSLYGYY
ncbi:MAG: hypothetical protein QXK37_02275 [Candidatus Woesearchaeota archaeon]